MSPCQTEPPLKGIKIIELATMITGPLCGMMLADLGADVIKVELPGTGDPFRSFRGGQYSPHFVVCNRNKRSIELDLKSAEGRSILNRLLETADVLIENFRPGVMERLGFGWERLRQDYPRLIYCSITGFGIDGPYRDRPAYDAVAQALGGMTSLFVNPTEPSLSGPTIADNVTGLYAAHGVLAMLYRRESSGRGGRVDTNMLSSVLAFMPDPFAYVTQLAETPDWLTRVRASQSFALSCADDRLIVVHMSSQSKFWDKLIAALDAPELATDPRFVSRDDRIGNYVLLAHELSTRAAKQVRSYWEQRFLKYDVPFAPVNNVDATMLDPQVRALDSFYQSSHPKEGALTSVRRPIWFDGTRDDQPKTPPPALGEHGKAILSEIGNMPREEGRAVERA